MFSQLSIDEILCGNRENPLGVNVLKPELLLVLTLLLQLKITYIDGIFKLLRTEHMNVPMGIDTNEPDHIYVDPDSTAVGWERRGNHIEYHCVVPSNSTAVLYLKGRL